MFINLRNGLGMIPYWSILDFCVILHYFKCTWHWFLFILKKLFAQCYVSCLLLLASVYWQRLWTFVPVAFRDRLGPIWSVHKQFWSNLSQVRELNIGATSKKDCTKMKSERSLLNQSLFMKLYFLHRKVDCWKEECWIRNIKTAFGRDYVNTVS